MAKIDYDVGDLVVCVDERQTNRLKSGCVYTVAGFIAIGKNVIDGTVGTGVCLTEVAPNAPRAGFDARRFRKLPKKSQEFFAGETQTVRDLVPAE